MKRTIWFFSHYAAPPPITGALRSFQTAQMLIQSGWDIKIFASSAIHNQTRNMVTDGANYFYDDSSGVPFVYIKTRNYTGFGKARVLNLIDFYRGLMRIYRRFEKPDLIYASSPSPLTCIAAWKIAKRLSIPYYCEVLDLWPESIVDYLGKSPRNPVILWLYHVEKTMYQKAEKIIFSIPGGKDYITDKGWQDQINLNKVYYINTGINLAEFDKNEKNHPFSDPDLDDKNTFKAVYCGSIRLANDVALIVTAAEQLQTSHPDIRFLIYGDGDEKPTLEAYCKEHHIRNVLFKGRIDKKNLPYLLTHGDVNLLTYRQVGVWKYGGSQSKLFDYLASGKPILSSLCVGYDPIKTYSCGLVTENQTPNEFAKGLLQLMEMSLAQRTEMGANARCAAVDFDQAILQKKWKMLFCEDSTN